MCIDTCSCMLRTIPYKCFDIFLLLCSSFNTTNTKLKGKKKRFFFSIEKKGNWH